MGVGDGQGGLACCSPWSCKESDTTEQLTHTASFILQTCRKHSSEHDENPWSRVGNSPPTASPRIYLQVGHRSPAGRAVTVNTRAETRAHPLPAEARERLVESRLLLTPASARGAHFLDSPHLLMPPRETRVQGPVKLGETPNHKPGRLGWFTLGPIWTLTLQCSQRPTHQA